MPAEDMSASPLGGGDSNPQVIMARKNLFDTAITLISMHKENVLDLVRILIFIGAVLVLNYFIYQQSYKKFYKIHLDTIWSQKTLPNKENYKPFWDEKELSYEVWLKGRVSEIKDKKFILKAGENEKEFKLSPAYQASPSASLEQINYKLVQNWIAGKQPNFEILQKGDLVAVFLYSSKPDNSPRIDKIIKLEK